jgi:diacylglycerol kinase family enzyme
MTRAIEVILNAKSGAQRAQEIRERLDEVFAASGRPYHITEEKAQSNCEVLVAAGGDGTICGVAEAALRSDKTLGVIPLGTFNYFAKNLAIPLDPAEAAQVVLNGKSVRASVLDLNGRLILNNTSIGIHPQVMLKRRQLYRRWGRNQLSAYLSVALTALQPPPRLRVRLTSEGDEIVRETPLVMVCSNAHQMEAFALAGKECLAEGKFALYVAKMGGRMTVARLGFRTLLRKLRPAIDYEVICTSAVTIETLRRRRFRAAVDGELQRLESPLHFRVRRKSLCVIAPETVPNE